MRRLLVFTLLLLLTLSAVAQTPDPKKIPHYFGPYPNWANSPLTTVDANIQFGVTNSCDGSGLAAVASVDVKGAITGITVTNQGTGYTCAPDVTIASTYGNGASAHATFTPSAGYISGINLTNAGSNYFSPVVTINGDGAGATAEATIDPYSGAITGLTITNAGSGYHSATVQITDEGGTGTGAAATVDVSTAVIAVAVDAAGIGYRTPGGIRKFVDTLPGLGPQAANNLGQYVSVAHPDTVTYPGSDYYEIAVVEYSRKLHSDLPPTKLRGYIQLNKGTDANGQNTITPEPSPQFLGATIVATKDRPVRILFRNQLPTGAAGNLFLPVDTTLMGAGMGPSMGGMKETDDHTVYDGVRNPMCGNPGPKPLGCYTENRATLHLHGGNTPWISDGTPHQWTVPAGETTNYSKGVSASYVPDMWYDSTGNTIAACAGKNACSVSGATNNPGDGALTFYYTNQQSARLLFYHDHAWGITRLNVYAGEAAGYLITDNTEQKLIAPGGPLDASDPALGLGIPLVIQDRTFVPSDAQLSVQDPTWDAARWGGMGNFWYHHVYMPAQNPADVTGVSPYGRWMYGPWFWPPANADTTPYQPIPNPYYDASCDLASAPNGFCEPAQIPGTPNISVGMEQFNDTPLVNGTVYPSVTIDPKAYRFRILNAANDRFFNLQWYVADSSGTEVALKASELAAALIDPNVVPTPDTNISPAGPNWVQIGTEGGFLPTPVIVPNQPITWITDPTRFDVGNVDQHSMLVAPAERADVVVDFSKFAGKTLILYNDAPAAFPARQASYDYYTGNPDNSEIGGAPPTVPGFGPNTRTIMQVKVNAAVTTGPSKFSLSGLISAFAHKADGSGVFESGQHPIIVGQAGYNRAYGKNFTTAGDCSTPGTTTPCDGYARINQQGGDSFTFDTLNGSKLSIPLQPKALHDEMNASTFDEYGRMTANLGVEAVPATAGAQNVILYPYVNPATELIDASKLPTASGIQITPVATTDDGTQIWKITHNGVDTHPIHFHLYDVQVINRVTWDNIIIPPDLTELGWKDTVRVSPLEDTYVALRPVIPTLPFQLPNSIRPLNPMVPLGMSMGFNSIGPDGQATASTITNDLVNFGWEYVWHCHILSHEEMDMMRPVSVAVPPTAPDNLGVTSAAGGLILSWNDTSKNATSFTVQRATDSAFTQNVTRFAAGNQTTYTDSGTSAANTYFYRVYASNTVGGTDYSGFSQSPGGGSFQTMTVDSGYSNTVMAGPKISVNPASLSFQLTAIGSNRRSTVTVTNTGIGQLTVSLNINGADFSITNNQCNAGVAAGQNCTFRVQFAPTASGTRNGLLTITSNDVTTPQVTVPLSGVGTALNVTPNSLAFGFQAVNTPSAPQTITVANVGSTPITVNSITLGGANGGQFSQTNTCGSSIAANSSCTVSVTFKPTGTNSYQARVIVSTSDPAGNQNVQLTGTGAVPQASLTPASLTFTSQLVGTTSAAQSITLTNTGNPALTISGISITGTDAGSFAQTNNCGTSLAAGAACSIDVTMSPATPTALSAAVSVNSAAGIQTVTLTGAGMAPQAVLSTATLTFAPQLVGTSSAAQTVTLSNPGNAPLPISSIAISGTNASSFAQSNDCGTSLAASASCTISVTMSPASPVSLSATLAVNSSVGAKSVALSGSGIAPQAVLGATSLTFAAQLINTTSPPQTVTLSNPGNAPLPITSVALSGANAASFAQSNDCGTSLAAGATCTFSVTMTPTASGAVSASLIASTSLGAKTVTLTGSGFAPSVTVVSPNGGEIFAAGTPMTIQWNSVGVTGTVNIALLKAGVGYKSIATGVSPTAGSYTWTIPGSVPVGSDYTVRVMSATNSAIIDVSNAAFSVVAPLTVTAPNGGETFYIGSTQTVTWTSLGISGNVNVSLLKAGAVVQTIATNVPVTAGSVSWTLIGGLIAGVDYTVRVMSATDSTIVDASNTPFTIVAPVTVLAPNGGETWVGGSTQAIQWSAPGVTGNVDLALLKAGVGLRTIASGVPATAGSFSWAVPTNLASASDYTIRVTSSLNGSIVDVSNAPFSIVAPVTVLSPNGGEVWQLGSTQTITWSAPGITGNVNITLLKAGVGYRSIATNVPANTASITWTVPTNLPIASDYTVRVMSATTGTLIDVSNATFAVAP